MKNDEALEAVILEYLTAHSNAADTLTGIQEWWQLSQALRDERPQLRRVLDRLILKGILEKTSDGQQDFYRLKRR